MEIDNNDNIYLLSSLNNPATFGANTLYSNGSYDIVVSKNDQNGNVIWANSFGGTSSENPTDISIDNLGNIYITGFFSSPTIDLGVTTLINQGGTDVFIIKLNSNGAVLWATTISGSANEKAYSIDVSANGKLAITGSFNSPSINFGLNNYSNNSSSQDLFISELDDQGNPIWLKTGSGIDPCSGVAVAFDQNNNLFVSGVFLNYWMTIDSYTLINQGVNDIFLLKINDSDSILWISQLGGGSSDYVNCMEVDNLGNVILAGYFMSSSFQIGTTIHTNFAAWDMYMAKFDNDGNSIFSKSFGGNGDEAFDGVHSDHYGNIYLTGKFSSSSIDFDSYNYTNTNPVAYDAVFVKLNTNGDVVWSDNSIQSGTAKGFEISTDSNSGTYVIGSFSAPELNLGIHSVTNINNGLNGYFAKYNQPAHISENENAYNLIESFPNPFEKSISFNFNTELSNGSAILFDLYGQQIMVFENIKGKTFSISNLDLTSGTYLISFYSDAFFIGVTKLLKM